MGDVATSGFISFNPIPPPEPDTNTMIIDRLDQGFVLEYQSKEYACESESSLIDLVKRLLSNG
jgi:hypothetical protein